MLEDEVDARKAILARLFDAFPSSGATVHNPDETLEEYVNATRGVRDLKSLDRMVGLIIDFGGQYLPSAGDLIARAAYRKAEQDLEGADHSVDTTLSERVEYVARGIIEGQRNARRYVMPIGAGHDAEKERTEAIASGRSGATVPEVGETTRALGFGERDELKRRERE